MNNIYISKLAGKPLTEYLKSHGFNIDPMPSSDYENSPVYEEISTHTDIHMCQIGLWKSSRIFPGNISRLGKYYPGNIIYNAVCTGKYFIHNLKYTDPQLMEAVRAFSAGSSLHTVNVKQGYTRCTCLPVDDSSFITSDAGISKCLVAAGADVLTIRPGYITLPGFDYGFIGGCAGNILAGDKRTIVFNGDLSSHPDYKKIAAFIKDRDIDIVYFNEYPLEDIGSILSGSLIQPE